MTATVLRLGQGTRRLDSWVGGFMEFTEGLQSNEPFRLWSAITMVAGALERKVWLNSQGSAVYPNLYTFLVGPPGTGKTRPVLKALEIWSKLAGLESGCHHAARVSLTKAALMDQLANSHRVVGEDLFNSLLIPSLELGALIPNYDPDFLNALTYLYDGIKYDEQRRGNKEPLIIEKPIVNLIGCTTPSYLMNTLPAGAWDQGFLARVIVIYSDVTDVKPLNLMQEEEHVDRQLHDALYHDIQEIGQRVGRIRFTIPAAALIEQWTVGGANNAPPTHPRLLHYNTRRAIHLLKLCIIATADSGHANVELEDAQRAINWLVGAEARMGDVFTAMVTGGDSQVMNEAWHYACTRQGHSKGIPVGVIREFLSSKVPAMTVQRIFDEMLRCGMLEHATLDGGVAGVKARATFRQIY